MLSIIIPTLNEEDHLPLLLDCIKKQNFKDYEIIVADAKSTDKTIEIAKKNNCKVVLGGLPGRARNEGSKIANGDLFLFLDADVLFDPNFLEVALRDFNNKNLDVATFRLFFTGGGINRLASQLYNFWVVISQPFFPHTFGAALLVKREVYKALGGFNEEIVLAEDHDFARRAVKIAKCGIIKSTKVFTSDRRFRKDGWIKTAVKYLLCEVYQIFFGSIKSDIFKYRFGHYKDKDKKA